MSPVIKRSLIGSGFGQPDLPQRRLVVSTKLSRSTVSHDGICKFSANSFCFFFIRDIQTATCLSISHQKNSSASRYGIVEDDIEKSTPGVPHKASAKNKYMVAPKRPFNFVDFCHSQRIYHTEKCAFYERATCGSVTVKKFNTSIL